jgi:hypothetical protein
LSVETPMASMFEGKGSTRGFETATSDGNVTIYTSVTILYGQLNISPA